MGSMAIGFGGKPKQQEEREQEAHRIAQQGDDDGDGSVNYSFVETTPLLFPSMSNTSKKGHSKKNDSQQLHTIDECYNRNATSRNNNFFDTYELRFLIRKSFPLWIAYLLQYTLSVASIVSLGHVGSKELAANALGSMFAAVTCWSIGLGTASALDTLCSQAFTSPNPKLVSLHLQRGIVIILLLFVPIGTVWLHAEEILVALGQEVETSKMAGVYLRWLLPGAPAYLLFECMKKYLQAQGIMEASTYILIVCAPANVLLSYLLVLYPPLSLGFIGAPLAITITYWLMLLLIVLYARYMDGYQVWQNWSPTILFSGWSSFTRFAIPGVLMVCSQYWAFELVALAAGYLGDVQLASHSIVLITALLLYQCPYGIGVATSNRVGNLLGARKAERARNTAIAALMMATGVGVVNSLVLLIFCDSWGYMFTNDKSVVKMVATILPLCAAFQVSEEISAIGLGILCGQGRQRIGAIYNIIGYYLVALGLGLLFEFGFGWGLFGLWTGLTCASILIACGIFGSILMTDWQKEVEKCQRRVRWEGIVEDDLEGGE